MPPKGRPKPDKDQAVHAPLKRPVSPTVTPKAKRIKLVPPPAPRVQRARRQLRPVPLETISEEVDMEDNSEESYHYEEAQAKEADAMLDDEAAESTLSDEESVDIRKLIDMCVEQSKALTAFINQHFPPSEARESSGTSQYHNGEEDDEDDIPWAASGDEEVDVPEQAPTAVPKRTLKRTPAVKLPSRAVTRRGTDENRQGLTAASSSIPTDDPSRVGRRPRAPLQAVPNPNIGTTAKRSASTTAPTPADPFDGSYSVLDSSLWPAVLRKMYSKVVPPPRRVTFSGRADGAQPDTPSFQRWSECTSHLLFFKRVLEFTSNSSYFNLARGDGRELVVVDTQNVSKPLRYLARDGSNTPALFISLVEVVQSNLVRAVRIARKNNDGWLDKKALIACWFSQELELNVCRLGEPLDTYSVTLPCWSNRDDLCGLTFQTRLANAEGPVTRRPIKSALYAPGAAAQNMSKIPIQLFANQSVPVIDAAVDGFDLSAPFTDLKQMPSMHTEPPAGSIGVAFYTISDTGDRTPLDFNIQAFALLAATPRDPTRAE